MAHKSIGTFLGASLSARWGQTGSGSSGLRFRSSLDHLPAQMVKTAYGALRIPCALADRDRIGLRAGARTAYGARTARIEPVGSSDPLSEQAIETCARLFV